jgi:hypothetical protein
VIKEKTKIMLSLLNSIVGFQLPQFLYFFKESVYTIHFRSCNILITYTYMLKNKIK